MKNRILQITIAVGVCVAVGVLSQGFANNSKDAPYTSEALVRQAETDSAIRVVNPASLTAALPSVVYNYEGRQIRISSVVATGRFSDPRRLPSTVNSEEPESNVSPPWQRGTMTFTVDQTISSGGLAKPIKSGDAISVEMYFDPGVDLDRAESELAGLSKVLVYLTGGGADAAAQWAIADNGALIGTVDATGQIAMLAATKAGDGHSVVDGMLVDIATVNDVAAAARTASAVVVR